MLAPISAAFPAIRTALGPVPLYWQGSKLNRDKPAPPYALLQPVSQPADPSSFDSVLVFGLDVWGPLWKLSEIAASLEWLDGHQIGVYEGLQNIRYTRQGRTMFQEPEALMPDKTTELWHLSESHRARYFHLPGPAP